MSSIKVSKALWPVLFGFFIMGFVDMIGIATHHVKTEFALTDTVGNLISLSCFFWFFVLSVPTGILMGRIGRKNIVLISFALTAAGMCLPLCWYSYAGMLVTFSVIGIANAILQVSLNPLVSNVVDEKSLTGVLTLGQFVKAVSSFLGPLLVSAFVAMNYGWRTLFAVYAVISLVAFIWLWAVRIDNDGPRRESVSFRSVISLLGNPFVLSLFVGILVLVGVDVGMNVTFPKFLEEKCAFTSTEAGLGNSVYFFARTLGALAGGFLLLRLSEKKFFTWSAVIALAGLVVIAVGHGIAQSLAGVVVFGLGYANLFAIIFGVALKYMPDKRDEISALLIVGVGGGALLPPVLGVVADLFLTETAAVATLAIVWCYILWLAYYINKTKIVG